MAALAFAIYARLASRDLGWMDSVEFALAGATFGIPHATGYPLYTLLVRLVAATGLDPAYGANLLSALSAAAACGACVVFARWIGLGWPQAAAAALSLAFAREMLAQATVAEVYALHLFLVVLLLLAGLSAGGLREEGAGHRDFTRSDRGRGYLLIAFLLGTGLAHHATIVLALPAVLVLALSERFRPSSRSSAIRSSPWPAIDRGWLAALILLPLVLYGALYFRSLADPVLDAGDPETLGRLAAHASGRQFGYRFAPEATYAQAELGRIARELAAQWTPAHLPLAALGLAALARRNGRRIALALILLVAATLAYMAMYHIPDKGGYLLPVVFVLAIFIGAGAQALSAMVARRPWGKILSLIFLAGLVLAPALRHVPAADRREDRSLRDLTFEVARRTTPGSLIVIDDTSVVLALLYFQQVEGAFTDREVVASYLLPLPWYAERVARIDPTLPANAAAKAAARRVLKGRALGERTAADAVELAAEVVRRAVPQRDVFLYFHAFEEERRTFGGLPLADRGLVYQVIHASAGAQSTPVPDADFARRAAYEPNRRLSREERGVARRFAVAANRAGIARVARGDFAGGEAELRQAVALEPRYAQAWFNLGVLAADYLGRQDEALRAWRKYLALAPGDANARAVRARLVRLEADSSRAHR